jgi:hypothetical protein
LKVTTDERQDDAHWWVARVLPESGVMLTLTTDHGDVKTGTIVVYVAASDITGVHLELSDKGVKVNDVQDDLFDPGSGVMRLNLEDPDGNQVLLVQAQSTIFATR